MFNYEFFKLYLIGFIFLGAGLLISTLIWTIDEVFINESNN